MSNTSSIVSKVWSFCNPLRDVGVGYGDYLEQLTYLLFLKMADKYILLGLVNPAAEQRNVYSQQNPPTNSSSVGAK